MLNCAYSTQCFNSVDKHESLFIEFFMLLSNMTDSKILSEY